MNREDSADLMILVCLELGFSEKAQRFPLKATCLAIYSRAVNAEESFDAVFWASHFHGGALCPRSLRAPLRLATGGQNTMCRGISLS